MILGKNDTIDSLERKYLKSIIKSIRITMLLYILPTLLIMLKLHV